MSRVKFENNSATVKGEFNKSMERALYAIGVTAQADIVKYMSKPDFTGRDIVETGRLRASISFLTPEKESGANDGEAEKGDALSGKGEDNTVIIGSNVEYASTVNNGLLNQPARKFIENGLHPNQSKYGEIAQEIFEGKV